MAYYIHQSSASCEPTRAEMIEGSTKMQRVHEAMDAMTIDAKSVNPFRLHMCSLFFDGTTLLGVSFLWILVAAAGSCQH